jgi:hypothetical protein
MYVGLFGRVMGLHYRRSRYTLSSIWSAKLATADINALKLALQKQRLAEMLVDELDFLGHIPRSGSPKVQAY